MFSFLDKALAHCTDIISPEDTTIHIAGALFIAGLAGGFVHCSLMCGPFVLAQISHKLEQIPIEQTSESLRFKSALLFPYHLGRITTYTVLGALMGGLVGGLSQHWKTASALILLVAGLGLLLSVAYPGMATRYTPLSFRQYALKVQNKLLHFAAPVVTLSPFGWRGYILGLALGLLPCGMVWSGLLVAAGVGTPLDAAFVMLSLGIGTIPGLVVTAFAGHTVVSALRIRKSLISKALLGGAGMWLCFVSVSLLQR